MDPSLTDDARARLIDEEHLRLLSIGYLVSAGLSAFFSLFGLMYATMGAFIGAMPTTPQTPEFEHMKGFFLLFGLAWTAIALLFAALDFYTSRCLQKRKSRVFCMVVAALQCPAIPHGTLLGVCTFLVLSRPSVERIFDASEPAASSSAA